jgi:pimeloyl-ACP methyl ester carboxylesterase
MESRMITVSNGRAQIRVFEAGKGQDLVFFHGAGGLMPDDPFVAKLAEHYRVHAPLLPGYGDSEGAENFRDMLDITLLAGDILDALGVSNPIVVGHSMGGMIAAELAAVAPQAIAKLVLICPAGIWLDEHPIPDLFSLMPHEYPELLFHDVELGTRLITSGLDLENLEFLAEFLITAGRQLGMAGKILFPIPERGLKDRLYRIRAKTVIVWGDEDRLIRPVYAREFSGRIPRAELVSVAAAGHMVTIEQTQKVVDAIALVA